MTRLPFLLVTIISLVASNAWALRLSGDTLETTKGAGHDQFARRLPHFRTWDSDIFFNAIDCSAESGSWTLADGDGDGEKISISWSTGSSCSFAGDITLKRGLIGRRRLSSDRSRRLEDGLFNLSFRGSVGFLNNKRDAILLSGVLTDGDGNSKNAVILIALSTSTRRRRLEDGIARDISIGFDASILIDTANDLIKVIRSTDGSELTSPDYSTYIDPASSSDSNTPSSTPASSCFPEVATAQVKGTGPVAMKNLQLGDLVLTTTGNEDAYYEKIYAFGHYSPKTEAAFVQLVTDDSTLEMTGEHLVFVANKVNPVRADSIQVGDILQPAAKVAEINTVHRKGLYAPLTASGRLVVDDILASSYISLQDEQAEFVAVGSVTTGISQHWFVHLMLSPFRTMCSGMMGSKNSDWCHAYNDDGLPHFIGTGMDFQHWVENQNVALQWMLLGTVLMIAGVCMFVENLFGVLAVIPTATVIVGGAAFVFFKANHLAVRGSKVKRI
ncbi:Desert hedgehog protein [Seminavis robusta]|uniref:Desert hedgehog protein n=1 Tax=Seminavis robusta TaxID=568900 RepID=A0A9N8H1S3_9STRA|nr:Desert hedgehog protein [Seminavis robusta]|eukprot:Sro47_g027980.1 Desert hedgehog protein (500) ;mRNA; f:139702-141201